MLQRSFINKKSLITSFSVFVLSLFMSACATQQSSKESSIDENIESMKQLEEMEKSSASVIVDQDLGLLSLHERNEKEALKNLQNEVASEEVRLPAAEQIESITPELNDAPKVSEEAALNKEASEAPAPVSTEELSQQLFDADTLIVKKGDSMSALAAKHLGDKKAWKSIWTLNPQIQNPNIIEIGTKLYIPHSNQNRGLASIPQEAAASQEAAVAASVSPKAKAPKEEQVPSSPVKLEAKAKKVPRLNSKVQYKTVKDVKAKVSIGPSLSKDSAPVISAAAQTDTPPATNTPSSHSPNLSAEAIDSAFAAGGTGTSHSTDELLQEHLDIIKAKKYKGKKVPETLKRKISSVNDVGPDQVESPANGGLSKIISLIGFILIGAVIVSFIFSKPSKNQ